VAPTKAIAGGATQATGNAPGWFPGSTSQGELEGHAHTATLSGFKSQSLDASQTGSGAHNQLVFDDTPGQGRVLAHTTQNQTWLQIGHLLQQNDNQRLARRGHGLELHTKAQGALRAASGLHISTHARQGSSTGQGQPIDTREAQSQLQSHAEMLKALSSNAQTQLAKLPNEPAHDQLQAHRALQATLGSLKGVQSSSGAANRSGTKDGALSIDGGHGHIPVTERPDLILSAAADISSSTPAHTVISAAQHTTVTAAQDTNLLSQRHAAWAVKDGISLFTRGEAKDTQRAVQDIGMKLHAASGNVNTQAQSDAFTLTAEKAIDLQSTAASIVISAPSKIMLNGAGGYIKIEGGDIEIGTSGNAAFLASMKELTGGNSLHTVALSFPHNNLQLAAHAQQQSFVTALLLTDDEGFVLPSRPYRIWLSNGQFIDGISDENGLTAEINTHTTQVARIELLKKHGAMA
jgi:type VI secretion system secreted protein VgrG